MIEISKKRAQKLNAMQINVLVPKSNSADVEVLPNPTTIQSKRCVAGIPTIKAMPAAI